MADHRILISILLFSYISLASAQEEIHSDIEFSYEEGKIVVEAGAEGLVFEGEFGEGAFANFTSEPGIASEVEEGSGINADNVVGFNVLGDIFYWDGTQFVPPGDSTITVSGVGGAPDTTISANSGIQRVSFDAPTNLLGQASDDGDFHVDPGFTISDGARAGGYGLLLSLSSNDSAGVADSDPFGVFLNFGLEHEAFESGVEAFGAVVPEPSAAMSVFIGFVVLSLLRPRDRFSIGHQECLGDRA